MGVTGVLSRSQALLGRTRARGDFFHDESVADGLSTRRWLAVIMGDTGGRLECRTKEKKNTRETSRHEETARDGQKPTETIHPNYPTPLHPTVSHTSLVMGSQNHEPTFNSGPGPNTRLVGTRTTGHHPTLPDDSRDTLGLVAQARAGSAGQGYHTSWAPTPRDSYTRERASDTGSHHANSSLYANRAFVSFPCFTAATRVSSPFALRAAIASFSLIAATASFTPVAGSVSAHASARTPSSAAAAVAG